MPELLGEEFVMLKRASADQIITYAAADLAAPPPAPAAGAANQATEP